MIKCFKIILFSCIAFLFVLTSCKASKPSADDRLIGVWTGEAYQFDIDEGWDMVFRYNKKEKKYSIQYPSLGCGGDWILEQGSNNKFQFRELLSEGFEICNDRGKVELIWENPDKIAFFYYWPDDGVLNASGYLYRSGK